jgi:hypothetical protein
MILSGLAGPESGINVANPVRKVMRSKVAKYRFFVYYMILESMVIK